MVRVALSVLALAVGAALVLAAEIVMVSQRDRRFNPNEIKVAAGTVIRVMNDDRVTHHLYVDSPTMRFDSGEQPVGKSVDLVFDRSGTFTVRCAIHPTMKLDVTVE